MVKALDLRSNGHMSAWVRTPLLVEEHFVIKDLTKGIYRIIPHKGAGALTSLNVIIRG